MPHNFDRRIFHLRGLAQAREHYDATIIAASDSTKNAAGERDPEMQQPVNTIAPCHAIHFGPGLIHLYPFRFRDVLTGKRVPGVNYLELSASIILSGAVGR